MNPLPTWTCIICSKKFGIGEWTCLDGMSNHVVESKRYLLADAPTDPGHPVGGGMDSKRDGRTRICNIPPDKQVVVNGEVRMLPGGYIEFIRGRYATDNPEFQYYLDKKGGWCTEEEWNRAWLSDHQQLEIERMKVDAMRLRLENERNELLAQVKREKRA